ncbi:DeoR/GlpR family DNA-binding transcription regulator [Siphonobacter sp. SORGH_AS_0500]|uniref:DeoR/GlpR family DNA-binding transcription regulator n=1 Tax=Siphonobacter sp. SORGH_AS_0500 TaxID=1864824 RepID=UPI0018E3CB2E|nr:DeoR/GlpR family DNA-binding transcription regulator [Siphonobacter sp. SORGH_AS_0500]
MLREERLQYILQKLVQQQRVSSVELSQELNVSDDTIRRDLNELAKDGLLKKVHGGAVPAVPKAPAPLKLTERIAYAQTEKQEIAQKALAVFESGQTIILDNGSTNMLIARSLPPELQVQIFTNSLSIAQILSEHPNVEVHLMGGWIFKRAQVTLGAAVINMIERLRPDLCIMGVCSIHHELGVTTPYWEEALVKQKMTQVSKKVIATAWKDKFNTAETCKVCDYEELDLLITSSQAPTENLSSYLNKGVEIW